MPEAKDTTNEHKQDQQKAKEEFTVKGDDLLKK